MSGLVGPARLAERFVEPSWPVTPAGDRHDRQPATAPRAMNRLALPASVPVLLDEAHGPGMARAVGTAANLLRGGGR